MASKFKLTFNSPVILVYTIIAASVALLDWAFGGSLQPYFALGGEFAFNSPRFYFSLFSYVVGHNDLSHMMGNMTFILLLGPILEEKYGSVNMLLMIVFTALFTALVNVLLFSSGILGASGIVFMLIVLISFANAKDGDIPITFILVVLLFMGTEFIEAWKDDNISQFGHIAGGICGGFYGFLFRNRKKKTKVEKPIIADDSDPMI